MGQHYHHIAADERNFIQRHLNLGQSQTQIAAALGRPRSAISREIRRNRGGLSSYDAATAAASALGRRRRDLVKLAEGSVLRDFVFGQIRKGWSPQQISGRLKTMPDNDNRLGQVSQETICHAIYVLPRGEIRKEIIGLLRQERKQRGAGDIPGPGLLTGCGLA